MRAAHRFALAMFALAACEPERAPPVDRSSEPTPAAPTRTVELVPRTPYLATFPCGEQCHDARPPDPRPRPLAAFHAGRVVEHGPALGWCDRCHAIDALDELVLLDGATRISFDESDRVCAQCHGEKHRDWRDGVHGLNTGGWRGTVNRRLCTACHDPHAPGDLRFEALPPPDLGIPRIHHDEHAPEDA